MNAYPGFAPRPVTVLLRLESAVALAAAIAAYQALGGNWWLFALLLLAPDLSMLGNLLGKVAGARFYNVAHTYTVPALLGGAGWVFGAPALLQVALIWIAHIGMDRALGYGLKYPGSFRATHLGVIGKDKKAEAVADAG